MRVFFVKEWHAELKKQNSNPNPVNIVYICDIKLWCHLRNNGRGNVRMTLNFHTSNNFKYRPMVSDIAKTLFFTIILIFTGWNSSFSQDLDGRLGIGFHAGGTIFFGDVKKNEWWPSLSEPNELRPAGGLQLMYAFTPFFSLKYNWTNGGLAGANPSRDELFRARFNEHTLQAVFNMTSIFFDRPDRAKFSVYGILGYGVNRFRTLRTTLSDGSFLQAFGYENQGERKARPTSELSIPIGLSIRSRIGYFSPPYRSKFDLDKLEVNLDFMIHFVNTDKLDAKETGGSGDNFSYVSLGLSYYFFE